MNFKPVFTAAKVVSAIYKIVSTVLLLGYLFKRTREGRPPPIIQDDHRSTREYRDYVEH